MRPVCGISFFLIFVIIITSFFSIPGYGIEQRNIALGEKATDQTLTDGDITSSYIINGEQIGFTLMIDLGDQCSVDSVKVYTGGSNPDDHEQSSLLSWAVDISNDETRWDEVGIIYEVGVTNKSEGGYDYSKVSFPTQKVRFIRIRIVHARTTSPCIGEIMVFGIDTKTNVLSLPKEFSLFQNFPNPFNSETAIKYQLQNSVRVTLKIYNILGQPVKELIDKELPRGTYSVNWDGKDDKGFQVNTGIYIYQIKAGESVQSKKALLLK
jgi:hypothetical protein